MEQTEVAQPESATRATGGPKTAEGKKRSSANAVRHGALSLRPVVVGLESEEAWASHLEGVFASLRPTDHLEEALTERIAVQLWRLGRIVRYETEAITANQELIAAGRLSVGEGLLRQWASTCNTEAEAERSHALALQDFLERFSEMPDALHLDRNAGVAVIWAAFGAAFGSRSVEISIPGIPDDDDEFDAFDEWTPGLLRRAIAAYAAKAGLTPERLQTRMMERATDSVIQTSEEGELQTRQRNLARRYNMLPPAEVVDKISRYEAAIERSLLRTLHELQRLQSARVGEGSVPVAVDVDVAATGFRRQ
jgi:hypothetical protein